MIKFSYIISNPPYNCEGLKAKQNMVFYKSFLEQGRKLANECYFVGPYSYLSSYKNLGITEIHKLGKETFDIAIQTAWVKIDSNQTENTFIDENILYSPIPKLKIEEKEVDMSLAGIFLSNEDSIDITFYKENPLSKTRENQEQTEVWVTGQRIKYTDNKELLERMKNSTKFFDNYRIIWSKMNDLKDLKILKPREYNLPYSLFKLLINNEEEGEKLIKYLNQNNLREIIKNVSNGNQIGRKNLSHIPLPLFLVPPDHQDQHFS